jgi:hypothetical protein
MLLSTVKSVIIGVGAAAAVIAITGAASGSGVGAAFNLGKTNTVNATSSLTRSTKHSMLSVTNKGAGPALSLNIGRGKAPFSVNSSGQVAGLNASMLSGLAASQFVLGGGQVRSFGFIMPTSSMKPRTLLRLPGFGTFNVDCGTISGEFGDVTLKTASHTLDKFVASVDSGSEIAVGSTTFFPNNNFAIVSVSTSNVTAIWAKLMLRYATGSGQSLTEHMATIDLMASVDSTTCDFNASAITGPGVKGP